MNILHLRISHPVFDITDTFKIPHSGFVGVLVSRFKASKKVVSSSCFFANLAESFYLDVVEKKTYISDT